MREPRYYQKCLQDEFQLRLKKNARYSLRAFARSLQIDASALSKILNGSKIPSPSISRMILKQLELTPTQESVFLLSMAKAYEASGLKRKKPEIREILKKNKTQEFLPQPLSADLFEIISDWYHLAILQLIDCKGINPSFKWIASQLRISEIQAKLAIQRLEQEGLLKFENGCWLRTASPLRTSDRSISTPALRKRIKQITEKSIFSLENDPIEIRNHTAMTMAIDPSKIPIAKKRIEAFMEDLCKELQSEKRIVYELQINLFPLQRRNS